ncbi:hypothetical protein BX666DRAFT_1987127 [Dichotomocladium elegans]|nr:hypothetical protein BX666DRAFT_1987127 [Dichotomocladium elegans]
MVTLAARVHDRAPQYQQITQELIHEHDVSLELEGCLAERQRLSQEIQSKQFDLTRLSENSKHEFAEMRKLRHLSFRSAAATLTGKKREKTAEGEAKYQLAFEEEQACKRRIEELSTELGRVADKQASLEQRMARIRQARQDCSRLLREVFESSTSEDSSFPLEPQLRAEIQNYETQMATATRDQTRFKDAEHNLVQAKRTANKVLRFLDNAINYVPFDLFGASMMDEHQLACLEGARRQTYEVQRRLNIARQVLPEIPYPAMLDVITHNTLLGLQLNMTYVDVTWKAKAQHSYALIITALANIDNSIKWVRHYLQYAQGAAERLQVAIESTRNALENERRRIFEGILSGEPIQAMGSANIDPPPKYEAPPDINNTALSGGGEQPPRIPESALSPPSPTRSLSASDSSPVLSNARPVSQPPRQPPIPATPPQPYVAQNGHNPFLRG